jgi:2-polyprenyl-3-methyl-5-hydroxy-6-metoxy-1,4-benzoquinol methylase
VSEQPDAAAQAGVDHFEDLRRNWEEFGRRSPVSAINSSLTTEDWGVFFESGEIVVGMLMQQLKGVGVEPHGGSALDFGCGAGRLSQALARHFERVTGVDVAESMIDLARSFNKYPGRCEYVLNTVPNLSRFADGSFDFSCSLLVLQHVGPELAEQYVHDLVRVLRPGGFAAFQLPSLRVDAEPIPAGDAGEPARYQATIALAPGAPPMLAVDLADPVTLDVVVSNRSPVAWRPEHQIRLGKRWLAGGTRRVLEPEDDGTRVLLPGTIEAGAALTVRFECAAPAPAGEYLLEVDLVQEGVTWFRNWGSPTLVVPCTVRDSRAAAAAGGAAGQAAGDAGGAGALGDGGDGDAAEAIVPRMEMHGVPRARVAEIVEAAGGTVVAACADHSAGPEWESFLYVVSRPA